MKRFLLYLCLFFSTFSIVAQTTCDLNPIPNHNFKHVSNGKIPDYWFKEDKVDGESNCGVTASNGFLTIGTCTSYIIDFNGNLQTFVSPNNASAFFPINGNPTKLKGALGFLHDIPTDQFACAIYIYDDCYSLIGTGNKTWNTDVPAADLNVPITYSKTGKGAFVSIRFDVESSSFWGDPGIYAVAVIGDLSFEGLVTPPTKCPAPNYLHTRVSQNNVSFNWDEDDCADFYTLRYRKEGDAVWIVKDSLKVSELEYEAFSPCSTYEMQIKVTRKDGAISDYTYPNYFTTQGCSGSGLCKSSGKLKPSLSVSKVTFKALSEIDDSISTNNLGYLNRGKQIIYGYPSSNLTIKAKIKGVAATEKIYWQFWLDSNGNKTFEANELILKKSTTGSEILQSSLATSSLPSTMSSCVLRIQASKTENIGACETNFDGQTLDYAYQHSFNNCRFSHPNSAEGTGNTTATIAVTTTPDTFKIRIVGTTKWEDHYLAASHAPLINLSGLLPCTSYECQTVNKCTTNGKLDYSDIYKFKTQGCNDHCKTAGAKGEYIKQIAFNTLSVYFFSHAGYADYSNATKVEAGQTYNYAASPGFPSGVSTQAEYWRVFIDYNEDNDFDDANEMVYDSKTAILGIVNTQITIPANTQPGRKRIRTVMKRITATDSTPPTACGAFTYGEVQDYGICVIASNPAKPTVAITGKTKLCEGETTILEAPTGNYDYLWSNNATTKNITVSQSGNYNVVFKDKTTGLSSEKSNNVTITVFAKPVFAINGKTAICSGSGTVLSVTGNESYLWSTGSTTSSINLSNVTASATYSVTVTNSSQCTATQSVQTNVLPLPILSIAGSKDICYGSSLSLTASGNGSFLWNTGYKAENFFVPSLTASNTYSVTLTDANQCTATQSVQINILPLPTINAVASNTNPCLGDKISLIAIGADTYTWSSITEGGLVTSIGGTVEAKPTKEGKITYSALGTDTKGCKSIPFNLDVTVKNCGVATYEKDIENNIIVYPNPFSEKIFFTNVEKIESISVYNALGQFLFMEKNITNNGIDFQNFSSQTYILKIEVTDGNILTKKIVKQ